MAQITLTDILGSDNIALSRPTINKNFQTLENSINTLENYLNTSTAGASLSVGSLVLTMGGNSVSTVLLNNPASAIISGNLNVGQKLTVNGQAEIKGLLKPNSITLDSSDSTLTLGGTHTTTLKLQNAVLIENPPVVVEFNSGDSEVTINNIKLYRNVTLDCSNINITTTGTVNLPTGEIGQRVYFTIGDTIASPTVSNGIYFSNTNFNPKYNDISSPTDVAIGFTAGSKQAYQRFWVELIYTTLGWEVCNAHPDTLGL